MFPRAGAEPAVNNILRSLTRLRRVWHRGGKRACARLLLDAACPVPYARWAARRATPDTCLAWQRARAALLPHRPLLVCMVGGALISDPAAVCASIRSVANQTYDHWQLWVNGARLQRDEADRAARWNAEDPRVRLRDGEPAPAAIADDAFVMALESGDRLAPDAFFETAWLLNAHPDTEILYWDEDAAWGAGARRVLPFFKPSWSPELLLSVNYLRHAFIKSALVRAAGGSVEPGTNAWDLAFRCAESARHIRHIPRVLYHRRGEARQHTGAADLCAVEAHARRIGLADPRAFITADGAVRLVWRPGPHRVSIIVPNKNRAPMLARCLWSILTRTRYPDFEVVVVDTGSTDRATLDYYGRAGRDHRLRIIERHGSFNFSAANNAGVRGATGDLLLFLNNDTEVLHDDWLEEMARFAERREIGAVGAKLLYPDGTIQHAGMVLGLRGIAHHIFWQADAHQRGICGSVDWYRNYLAVTGACMMMRREVFESLGGFDERYEVAYSDVELCLRAARRGYRIVYTPFAVLTHHEGATRGMYAPAADAGRAGRDAEEFLRRGDPYFHPALSRRSFVPSLPRWWERPREVIDGCRLAAAAEPHPGRLGGRLSIDVERTSRRL